MTKPKGDGLGKIGDEENHSRLHLGIGRFVRFPLAVFRMVPAVDQRSPARHAEWHDIGQRDLPVKRAGELSVYQGSALVYRDEYRPNDNRREKRAPEHRSKTYGAAHT